MYNKKNVIQWYEQEGQKNGISTDEIKKTPYHQKLLAFSIISVPLILSGCSTNEPAMDEMIEEESSFAAFEECEFEKEANGWELDCDDEDNDWYRTHGYTSKYARVPKTSKIYHSSKRPSYFHSSSPTNSSSVKSGVGSGGTSKGGSIGG